MIFKLSSQIYWKMKVVAKESKDLHGGCELIKRT